MTKKNRGDIAPTLISKSFWTRIHTDRTDNEKHPCESALSASDF
jgi:hypothetical protein